MGKITQLRLDRDSFLKAISIECERKTDRELSQISETIFGTHLSCCGTFDGVVFTTNLNMVKNATLLQFSNIIDVESRVSSIIKTAKATLTEESEAKAKATMELIRQGIFLDRKTFEQTFSAAKGGDYV